ncbi:hypothetical protein N7470_004888 [Penicillium chermesinum]|nr:hypothetical protein N7470_004888 [Penicillium chermesinum]
MAAPTQLAYRTLKGIGIMDAALPEGNLRCSAYSPCGRYFAWASPENVTIIDPSTGNIVSTIAADNVFELGFSPLGTYLITWQRPSKDANGDATKNLKVWRAVESGDQPSIVGSYVQKSQTGWNLQYTPDEKLCARVVTNEVQFYQSDNLSTVWNKLRVEGVSDFALSPGQTHSIAVFIPERKGQPASVKVFIVPQFGAPVSQKSFFKGDKVQLKWNSSGTTLIVLAQTEVDRTGKSYYGETTLYLLSASGAFDSRVDLDKEGPIHDVSWNPNSKEFGVVYGYMPAKTTIFNLRGVAKHNFPLEPAQHHPVLAPWTMDIYDMDKNFHKITTVEASNASVCAWSPDGQYILTATTSPRLRVDNGIRIWHVSGGLMYNEDMNELLPVKPAGAYRPPGARGQLTPLAFKREDQGGAAFVRDGVPGASMNGFGKPRHRTVPGAEPAEEYLPPGAAPGGGVALPPGADGQGEKLSKSAAKNKKKREAAKKAKEEENAPPPNAPTGPSPDRNRNRGKNNGSPVNGNAGAKQASAPASAPAPNPTSAPAPPIDSSAQDKKIRGLLKKIRAIDELKMRLAGGEKLEDTQMKKIQTEDSVRKELDAVGYSG